MSNSLRRRNIIKRAYPKKVRGELVRGDDGQVIYIVVYRRPDEGGACLSNYGSRLAKTAIAGRPYEEMPENQFRAMQIPG